MELKKRKKNFKKALNLPEKYLKKKHGDFSLPDMMR